MKEYVFKTPSQYKIPKASPQRIERFPEPQTIGRSPERSPPPPQTEQSSPTAYSDFVRSDSDDSISPSRSSEPEVVAYVPLEGNLLQQHTANPYAYVTFVVQPIRRLIGAYDYPKPETCTLWREIDDYLEKNVSVAVQQQQTDPMDLSVGTDSVPEKEAVVETDSVPEDVAESTDERRDDDLEMELQRALENIEKSSETEERTFSLQDMQSYNGMEEFFNFE